MRRRWVVFSLAITLALEFMSARPRAPAAAQEKEPHAAPKSGCFAEPTQYHGWDAERLANPWVTLIIVPQLGGRLMQVTFGGHDYLFVNPQYYGKYFPPSEAARQHRWFNYGGDKNWPLPEGNQDEKHWPVGSDVLDDGVYKLSVVASGDPCTVRLEGPTDDRTGLQYRREISLEAESPHISFVAVMKNIAAHPIRWSIQSVTQYDTSGHNDGAATTTSYNQDFWAFTPINPASVFNRQYDAHAGPIDHPSYSVRSNKLFALHWTYLEGEVGIDSRAGWLAVVDGASHYAMVERFHVDTESEYPDRASEVFYISGPSVRLSDRRMPELAANDSEHHPYYMEAELNSPLVTLAPGEGYALDTDWFPTRMTPELTDVNDAGAVGRPLSASRTAAGVRLAGVFGVFWPGTLVARWYDRAGTALGTTDVAKVTPREEVSLAATVAAPAASVRLALHLTDSQGKDRGALGETTIEASAPAE